MCDELDDRVKHAHTMLSTKESALLEQLETLFNDRQGELCELQIDHEKDKEPFMVKLEAFIFGTNESNGSISNNNNSANTNDDDNNNEALASLLGFCFYKVCVSASLSFFDKDESGDD